MEENNEERNIRMLKKWGVTPVAWSGFIFGGYTGGGLERCVGGMCEVVKSGVVDPGACGRPHTFLPRTLPQPPCHGQVGLTLINITILV